MKINIYVEGGGQAHRLKTKCREGFREFLQKAGVRDGAFSIMASGSRNEAYNDFRHALQGANAGEFIVLLVDSESPVATNSDPWQHLLDRDGWERPASAGNDHAQLMVQFMESWFIADKESLAKYFGQEFNPNALPSRAEIEEISKDDVLRGLKQATRHCQKGEYGKRRHSFDILALIDPHKVINASPYAERLIETLKQKAEA